MVKQYVLGYRGPLAFSTVSGGPGWCELTLYRVPDTLTEYGLGGLSRAPAIAIMSDVAENTGTALFLAMESAVEELLRHHRFNHLPQLFGYMGKGSVVYGTAHVDETWTSVTHNLKAGGPDVEFRSATRREVEDLIGTPLPKLPLVQHPNPWIAAAPGPRTVEALRRELTELAREIAQDGTFIVERALILDALPGNVLPRLHVHSRRNVGRTATIYSRSDWQLQLAEWAVIGDTRQS